MTLIEAEVSAVAGTVPAAADGNAGFGGCSRVSDSMPILEEATGVCSAGDKASDTSVTLIGTEVSSIVGRAAAAADGNTGFGGCSEGSDSMSISVGYFLK